MKYFNELIINLLKSIKTVHFPYFWDRMAYVSFSHLSNSHHMHLPII